MISTLGRNESSAEICRAKGWAPGTRLSGDEGYGPTVIEIIALGARSVFAKTVSQDGRAVSGEENFWDLTCRDWRLVGPPPATAHEADPRVQAIIHAEISDDTDTLEQWARAILAAADAVDPVRAEVAELRAQLNAHRSLANDLIVSNGMALLDKPLRTRAALSKGAQP